MGFFSDLIDLAPHRTVAHEIKEYCSNSELSDKESNILNEYGLNKKQFIWLRNSYNYCVFQAFLVVMNNHYPNSLFMITKSTLDSIIYDVFHTKYAVQMLDDLNVPLPSSYGLWSDYFEEFCSRIEEKNQTTLSTSAKYELERLTNSYQDNIAEFIKIRKDKLKKPL